MLIGGKEYFLASEIVEANRARFIGCGGRNIRKIPEKKNLSVQDYLYAKEKSGVWEASTVEYNRAKLLLSKKWVDEYLAPAAAAVEKSPETDVAKYQECPTEIDLQEQDLFRDDDGNLFKVRMVGERSARGCYFCAKDVSECFDLPNLRDNLNNTTSDYERGSHYVTFIHTSPLTIQSLKNRTAIYLTFKGAMKALFSSKRGCAEKFVDWCMNIVFTATFGSEEEKLDLSANILSINSKNLKAVLDRSATSVPAVYLFSLTKRGSNVYKFGCTKDLKRRAREHQKTYGAAELEQFCYIDPKYIFEAETALKSFCHRLGTVINTAEPEVVQILSDDMKHIQAQFKSLAAQYSGHTADLQRCLEEKTRELEMQRMKHEKEQEMQRMKHEKEQEMQRMKHEKEQEIHKRDLEIFKARADLETSRRDAEIMRLSKDLEILSLKLALAERK